MLIVTQTRGIGRDCVIHMVNGDEWGERLRTWNGLEGEVFVWREMMDFGPFSRHWTLDEQIRRRAAFFEERIGFPRKQMEMISRYQEQRLDRIPASSPVVLWFDSDRLDQLMLLYLSFRLHQQGMQSVYLVEIPATRSEEAFSHLWDRRRLLDEKELTRAKQAWHAFISPNPTAVSQWLQDEPVLFSLHDVFRAHLEYLPSVDNGLNRVEERTLRLVEAGCADFEALFQTIREERPTDGLTDVHYAAIVNELAVSEGEPLLTMTDGAIGLTPQGQAVLAGALDRMDVLKMDWWWGGTHLLDDRWRLNATGKPVKR